MNIVLVELSSSHDECLYSQLRILREQGHNVDLCLHPELQARIGSYRNLARQVYFSDHTGGWWHKTRKTFQLYRKLRTYDRILFNTASSSKRVRNLNLLLLFDSVPCIGLLHDVNRLGKSFTQRLISMKIKKYFVLNDSLLPPGKAFGRIRLESFYPIYFPDFPGGTVSKPEKETWICVPGRLEDERRDYQLLLESLASNPLPGNFRILLLGKADPKVPACRAILDKLAANGLTEQVMTFPDFIPPRDYHAYIKCSDYIMPLMPVNSRYMKSKISGSINLAFAYKKALICREEFDEFPDLRQNALFYSAGSLAEFWRQLGAGQLQPGALYTDGKWEIALQAQKYAAFIDLNPSK